MPDPTASHRADAAAIPRGSIRCAVLTVSDTRRPETDESGRLAETLATEGGYVSAGRRIVPDEAGEIRAALEAWLADADVRAILVTGGTGISRRDTTIEVVRGLLTAELEGFGELFRMISYGEIASAAMLSRATAGLVSRPPGAGGDTFVFAMPGSPNAVRTAMTKLVVPELGHLIGERKKGQRD